MQLWTEPLAQTMRDLSVTLEGSAFYSIMEAGCYFPHLALKQVQTTTTTHEGRTGFPLVASSGRTRKLFIDAVFYYVKIMLRKFYHSRSI